MDHLSLFLAALLSLSPACLAQVPATPAKTDAPAAAAKPAPPAQAPTALEAAVPPAAKILPALPDKAAAVPKARASSRAEAEASASAPVDRLKAQWRFLQNAAQDQASVDAEADELEAFTRRHPDAPMAADALALLAKTDVLRKDRPSAMIALLHLCYEFPQSQEALSAQSDFLELAGKELSRKLRPAAGGLVKRSQAEGAADRLSAMLQGVVEGLGDALYRPTLRELRAFQVRFPDYARADAVQWSLAQLYERHEDYAAAVLAYRELLAVYPDSEHHPEALFALGGVYAEHLKEYKKAIDAYQELVREFPDHALALAALQATSRLFSDKLEQYELAVEVDGSIIEKFPKTAGALQALQDAAAIAHRRLKDYKKEVALREQIASDFPADAELAAEQLYEAGGVYEDDLNDVDSAIKTYQDDFSRFEKTKYGRKAGERAEKLQKKG